MLSWGRVTGKEHEEEGEKGGRGSSYIGKDTGLNMPEIRNWMCYGLNMRVVGRTRGGEGACGRLGWQESRVEGQVLQRKTQEPAQEGFRKPGQGFKSFLWLQWEYTQGVCLFLLEN